MNQDTHKSNSSVSAPPEAAEWLSALMDGELDPSSGKRADETMGLLSQESCLQTWSQYHLVREALRQDGESVQVLAQSQRCLQRWREAMEDSPSVAAHAGCAPVGEARMLPALSGASLPKRSANDGFWRWGTVACLTLVLVGGVAWLAPAGTTGISSSQVSEGGRSQAAPQVAANEVQGQKNAAQARAGQDAGVMIRDPQLDALIQQHRQAVGWSASQGGPSAYLRNATFEAGGKR